MDTPSVIIQQARRVYAYKSCLFREYTCLRSISPVVSPLKCVRPMRVAYPHPNARRVAHDPAMSARTKIRTSSRLEQSPRNDPRVARVVSRILKCSPRTTIRGARECYSKVKLDKHSRGVVRRKQSCKSADRRLRLREIEGVSRKSSNRSLDLSRKRKRERGANPASAGFNYRPEPSFEFRFPPSLAGPPRQRIADRAEAPPGPSTLKIAFFASLPRR